MTVDHRLNSDNENDYVQAEALLRISRADVLWLSSLMLRNGLIDEQCYFDLGIARSDQTLKALWKQFYLHLSSHLPYDSLPPFPQCVTPCNFQMCMIHFL